MELRKRKCRALIMSLLFCLAPLFVLAVGRGRFAPVEAVDDGELEKSRLMDTRRAVWEAWYRNDQKALSTLVPPDLIAINPGEEKWEGRPDFLTSSQDFANHHGRLIALEFPKTEMQMFGSTAILYSLYQVDFEYAGEKRRLAGRTTEVFIKRRGHWINVGWHVDSGS